jgi:hypothetical protein
MSEQLELDIPALVPATVRVDQRCSHITLAAAPDGPCDGAFVDLGPVLHWWSNVGVQLDPAGARALAAGLTAWADAREDR